MHFFVCFSDLLLKAPPNQEKFLMGFFAAFLEQLKRFVLPEVLPGFYAQGNRDSQSFVNHLALFFVAFLRENLPCLERIEAGNLWMEAHNYLVYLTLVDEREIFKGDMGF